MLKPLLDRVVVKMIESEEITKGGILLTNSSKGKSHIAEIIEVGSGGEIEGKEIKMYVEKGQKVILNKYSGVEVKYEGEDFVIVKQDDILAIID